MVSLTRSYVDHKLIDCIFSFAESFRDSQIKMGSESFCLHFHDMPLIMKTDLTRKDSPKLEPLRLFVVKQVSLKKSIAQYRTLVLTKQTKRMHSK